MNERTDCGKNRQHGGHSPDGVAMRIVLILCVAACASACGKKAADVTVDTIVSLLDSVGEPADATPIAADVTPVDVTPTAE